MTPQFEIWQEGEIQGPFDLEQLKILRASGNWPPGALWRRCGATQFSLPEELDNEFIHLPIRPTPPPESEPEPKPETEPTPAETGAETSRELLLRVRKHSNYGVLRGVLTFYLRLCLFVLAVVFLLYSVSVLYVDLSIRSAIAIGLTAVVLAVIAVFLLAIYQALMLVIDIADIAAEQARRKGP